MESRVDRSATTVPPQPIFRSTEIICRNHLQESFAGSTSDTSILPIAQPYPFRTDRILGLPDLSVRARWHDAGVARQRPAAFWGLFVNLVAARLSRRPRLCGLLPRETTASLRCRLPRCRH